jgi:hypothetical protein
MSELLRLHVPDVEWVWVLRLSTGRSYELGTEAQLPSRQQAALVHASRCTMVTAKLHLSERFCVCKHCESVYMHERSCS